MIENLLAEAQSKGITTVAALKTAIENGTCDTWESYRAYAHMEAGVSVAMNWSSKRRR
jgi:hypothetical protein